MTTPTFAPGNTPNGELPPWEIAKAFAFHCALARAAQTLSAPAHKLLGQRVDVYIAKQLTLKGGGRPKPRTVKKL